jgi:heme-degrading monooxygenase HmoA
MERRTVMFMRLVQVKVKSETADQLPLLYSEKIIPALQGIRGCLYASLIKSVSHPDESISMTLWDTLEHAEAYEQGGLFQKLMNEITPYLSDSSEWKIQLAKDFTWEYTPSSEEPVVKSYRVTTAIPGHPGMADPDLALYVRILSVRLKTGRTEEFARLYSSEILPVLHNVKGCRYAFLTEGVEERNEVISVTIWDSKDAADVYESSGLFRKLTRKVHHTFSELYQWKLAVEKRSGAQVSTTDDLTVAGYNVVSGRMFQ